VDDFIPGESTNDEVLQVIEELPDEKKPTQLGDSDYAYFDGEVHYMLIFQEAVLFVKKDPRWQLGNIISHYGHPTEVTWQLQQGYPDDFVADTTTLFFPQASASFTAEGQITYFGADTIFAGYIYTPSYYEEIYAEVSSKVSSDEEYVQHFPWPCD
jgi:hypothetical protein